MNLPGDASGDFCAWDECRNFYWVCLRERVCLLSDWQGWPREAGRWGCTNSQVLCTNLALILPILNICGGRCVCGVWPCLITHSPVTRFPGLSLAWLSPRAHDETQRGGGGGHSAAAVADRNDRMLGTAQKQTCHGHIAAKMLMQGKWDQCLT